MWQSVKQWLDKITGQAGSILSAAESELVNVNPCCQQDRVHIAYRGKSDSRLYIAYQRAWEEVRYFQPNGLRVFCARCRRRLL